MTFLLKLHIRNFTIISCKNSTKYFRWRYFFADIIRNIPDSTYYFQNILLIFKIFIKYFKNNACCLGSNLTILRHNYANYFGYILIFIQLSTIFIQLNLRVLCFIQFLKIFHCNITHSKIHKSVF